MYFSTVDRIFSVGEITVNYDRDYSTRHAAIQCSRDGYNVLRDNWGNQMGYREEFCILCLGRNNEVIGMYRVSAGGVSGTVADPKMIFQVALACHASAIILAHNHPSCNTAPSQADKDLTRKLKECGQLLQMPVLDHLILSPDGQYLSFADEGCF